MPQTNHIEKLSNELDAVFDKLRPYIPESLSLKLYEVQEKLLARVMRLTEWHVYEESRPTEYGRYEVYRKKCDKIHYETWNNTGWAYNNNDITHWRHIIRPR